MGVPVITLSGSCHAHNVGVSLLSALGMRDDWVCDNPTEYVAAAAKWAATPAALAELRASLRTRMLASPLCDTAAFLPGLESALEVCFQRWEAGGAVEGEAGSGGGAEDGGDSAAAT